MLDPEVLAVTLWRVEVEGEFDDNIAEAEIGNDCEDEGD